MQEICTNMQMRNMQYMRPLPKIGINIHLYADMSDICLNVHEGKYAIICRFKS